MRLTIATLVTTAALCAATPVAGQSFLTAAAVDQLRQPQTPAKPAVVQPKKPSKPRPKVAVVPYVNFDFQQMLAKNSFKAVLGQSFMLGFGGGIDIANLGGPIFLRVGVSMSTKSGERTIVTPQGAVITTGIPLKVSMLPIELGGGWRSSKPTKKVPYVGAALLLMNYKEHSDEVDDDENTSENLRGYELFGGVDMQMSKAVALGLEGQYRSFRNKIGTAGASAVFGENDLGGIALRVRLAFKF
jgi:opacity protein-like surface antigen